MAKPQDSNSAGNTPIPNSREFSVDQTRTLAALQLAYEQTVIDAINPEALRWASDDCREAGTEASDDKFPFDPDAVSRVQVQKQIRSQMAHGTGHPED